MQIRGTILTLLIFFRVLVMPLWYSTQVSSIHDKAGVFEQIKLHKRRSIYHEESSDERVVMPAFEAIEARTSESPYLVKIFFLVKQWIFTQPVISRAKHCRDFLLYHQYLFLRNRMLRL